MTELEKINQALQTIREILHCIKYDGIIPEGLFERVQALCEACNQPTRDALLMVLSSIACEVMNK